MFSKKKAAAGVTAAALVLTLMMTGCGANPKAALIKIDTGDTIEYGYEHRLNRIGRQQMVGLRHTFSSTGIL